MQKPFFRFIFPIRDFGFSEKIGEMQIGISSLEKLAEALSREFKKAKNEKTLCDGKNLFLWKMSPVLVMIFTWDTLGYHSISAELLTSKTTVQDLVSTKEELSSGYLLN